MATLARDPDAPAPVERPAYITEAEYLAMCEAGVFGDDHIELVRGVLERMAPSGTSHGEYLVDFSSDLRAAYPRATHAVVADTFNRLERDLVRAPDIAVVVRPITTRIALPENTLLAVEIADATRAYDLTTKALDYARAGIPTYWVVDVRARHTHVLTGPTPDGYQSVEIIPFTAPLTVPGTTNTLTVARED